MLLYTVHEDITGFAPINRMSLLFFLKDIHAGGALNDLFFFKSSKCLF